MIDLPEAADVYLAELKARKAERIERALQEAPRGADDANIDRWDALHAAADEWRHIKGDLDL
jgi:hypothetical protein